MTSTLNISPDPNILIVLASTPLRPIDALCELIDNALDSFVAARRAGFAIPSRWVRITIPKWSQIENGEGVIRVVDNGIGLDENGLEGALKAGFSTKNKYDQLGLFGVGFNIATAKLGQKTVVTTAKVNDIGELPEYALTASIDLQELKKRNSFEIPLVSSPRPERGTMVEVSGWWPTGTPNDRFSIELAKISRPKLLEQLGRRYATVLNDPESRVNMTVNGETVIPFEHCVWSEKRAVSRMKLGIIPARISFDNVLRTARRCEKDGNFMAEGELVCSACGGNKTKQIEERVRGWIGVQRFDDKSNFGIDLIRNGRAIRVAEKDAFFTFTDDFGVSELEYPIDQTFGRIVGEVHLDHVPVDYTKQDFERPSREWTEAMNFLRGGGLQAKNRPDGEKNSSPLGKIFDGYRRTKKIGKEDMYMGIWSESGPDRISRDVEIEYYKRFKAREPGYWDDSKWWELVENASIPPVRPMIHCPSCSAENPDGTEECFGCGEIILGKNCIGCDTRIRKSANSCPACGASQRLEVTGPWRCQACDHVNASDEVNCSSCGLDKNASNPMAPDELLASSTKIDDLSFQSQTFRLVDGSTTQPLSVTTYSVPKDRLKPMHNQPSVPTYVPSGSALDKMEIYLDRSHVFFTELGFSPEYAVSTQVASFLQTVLGSTTNGKSTLNHTHKVLQTLFSERVSMSAESVRRLCEEIVEQIVELIIECDWARELSSELTGEEREELVGRLQEFGLIPQLETLQQTGAFLRYVPRALTRIFRDEPERWNGFVFMDDTSALKDFAPASAAKFKERNRNQTLRALDECAEFLDWPTSDEIVLRRVKSSVNYLKARLA
jgi:hypothetical protein